MSSTESTRERTLANLPAFSPRGQRAEGAHATSYYVPDSWVEELPADFWTGAKETPRVFEGLESSTLEQRLVHAGEAARAHRDGLAIAVLGVRFAILRKGRLLASVTNPTPATLARALQDAETMEPRIVELERSRTIAEEILDLDVLRETKRPDADQAAEYLESLLEARRLLETGRARLSGGILLRLVDDEIRRIERDATRDRASHKLAELLASDDCRRFRETARAELGDVAESIELAARAHATVEAFAGGPLKPARLPGELCPDCGNAAEECTCGRCPSCSNEIDACTCDVCPDCQAVAAFCECSKPAGNVWTLPGTFRDLPALEGQVLEVGDRVLFAPGPDGERAFLRKADKGEIAWGVVKAPGVIALASWPKRTQDVPDLDQLLEVREFVLAGYVAPRGLESLRLVEEELGLCGKRVHDCPPLDAAELVDLRGYLDRRVVQCGLPNAAVKDPRHFRTLLLLVDRAEIRRVGSPA